VCYYDRLTSWQVHLSICLYDGNGVSFSSLAITVLSRICYLCLSGFSLLYSPIFFLIGQVLQSFIQVTLWVKFWASSLFRFLRRVVTFHWSGLFFGFPVINFVPSSIFHYSIFCCSLGFFRRWCLLPLYGLTFSPLASSSECQYKSALLHLCNWFFVLDILLLFVPFYACFLLSLPTGVLQLEGFFLFQISFVCDFFFYLF